MACGNSEKTTSQDTNSENKKIENNDSKKEEIKKGVHTYDVTKPIHGTNYVYSAFNYDRSANSYLSGGTYYGDKREDPKNNHAQFFVGNDAGQLKEPHLVKEEADFKKKLLVSDNLHFFNHFRFSTGSAYRYPKVTFNKESKKTINGIEYLNLEFKVDFWVSEDSHNRLSDNPPATVFVNGYFTLLDGEKGDKVPFYAMQAWHKDAVESAKDKALAVLEEVLTTVRKK